MTNNKVVILVTCYITYINKILNNDNLSKSITNIESH